MLLLFALVAFPPIRDYDYGFHLATGRWIAAQGEVPATDVFSYGAPGARYVDAHWLFQLGLVALHALGGHTANRVAAGLCVLGVIAIVALRARARGAGAAGAAACGLLLVAMAPRILVRPEIVSFVLLAAVVALLHRHEERGGRGVLAVVPLQWLWANVHGLFALGLAAIACAFAAEVLRGTLGGAPLRRAHLARLAAVGLLSGLLALANPNGIDAVLQPLAQLGMIGGTGARDVFGYAIAELQPTLAVGGAALGSLPVAAALLLAVLAAGVLWRDRRGDVALDLLLLIAFATLALAAVRNVALFALVAALVVVRHAATALATPGPARMGLRAVLALSLLLLVSTAGALGAGMLRLRGGPVSTASSALADFHFPEAAVDWIERERPPGPLYHRLGDGGWLMWRLGPETKVLIDGRLEVYGPERYAETELLGDDAPAVFQRLDARYRFGSALVTYALFPDLTLLGWLQAHPDWTLVHVDDVAAVFVRDAPDGTPRYEEVDPRTALPPLEPEHAGHPVDLWRRRTRVWVLATLGHPREALALARETLARTPDPRLEQLLPWLEDQASRRPMSNQSRSR